MSCGRLYLPTGVALADPEVQHAVVSALMEKVSSKFVIPKELLPPPPKPKGEQRSIEVGASHAKRLERRTRSPVPTRSWPLNLGGERVQRRWRASTLLRLIHQVQLEAVPQRMSLCSSYLILASTWLAQMTACSSPTPRILLSTIVYGESVLAPRETQFTMLQACLPLLKMAEGRKAINRCHYLDTSVPHARMMTTVAGLADQGHKEKDEGLCGEVQGAPEGIWVDLWHKIFQDGQPRQRYL